MLKFYIRTAEENIPAAKIIYMRRTGRYGPENNKLMDTFKNWVKENRLYDEDTAIYAIPMDNPETTAPCQCRYDVCIKQPLEPTYDRTQIRCRKLEGGKYLIFLIPHTAEAVQTAWRMCFSESEKSGYLFDQGRPVMERYRKTLADRHYCELCIPILAP